MRIEKRLDENGKIELVVHQENEELYTELKGFRKVFLPLLGELSYLLMIFIFY